MSWTKSLTDRRSRGLLPAPALALLVLLFGLVNVVSGGAAKAGAAEGRAEVTVGIAVLPNPYLIVAGNKLPTVVREKSGYGLHEETVNGETRFADRSFDAAIFAGANAQSPPVSHSLVGFAVQPGHFMQVANPTNNPQSVDVQFFGSIILDAYAFGGYSAAAGFYDIIVYNNFLPVFRFEKSCRVRNTQFADCTKGITERFVIPPQDAYSFSVARMFAGAVAHVPEPSSWALMLAGFGAIGMALRRSDGRASSTRGQPRGLGHIIDRPA